MVSAHQGHQQVLRLFSIVGALPNLLVKLRLLFLGGLEGNQKSGGFAFGGLLIESFLASQRFYLALRSP